MPIDTFNIRVYALIVNEQNEILLSDEYRMGLKMTKFPGGGLEFGEGTIDCLKREAMEEFGQPIEIIEHFYTTDFFQKAMFFENAQLISVYYRAKFLNNPKFKISTVPYDFELIDEAQSFRWEKIGALQVEEFSFPIDRLVMAKLKSVRF